MQARFARIRSGRLHMRSAQVGERSNGDDRDERVDRGSGQRMAHFQGACHRMPCPLEFRHRKGSPGEWGPPGNATAQEYYDSGVRVVDSDLETSQKLSKLLSIHVNRDVDAWAPASHSDILAADAAETEAMTRMFVNFEILARLEADVPFEKGSAGLFDDTRSRQRAANGPSSVSAIPLQCAALPCIRHALVC
jgi:hypothetical protein